MIKTMGAFLSGEDVARKQDVDSTYLKQSEAVSDYVRRAPYDEDQKGIRRDLIKYTDDGILGIRGGYDGTMKNIYDGYNGELTTLRGGYGGNLTGLQSDLTTLFEKDINTLRGTYAGNLSELQTSFNDNIGTWRGGYQGNLGDLQNRFNTDISTLRGNYKGNLSDLQSGFNDNIGILRGTYEGNLSDLQTTLSSNLSNQMTSLRGGYEGNLSGLETKLTTNFNNDINKLRGNYQGNLSELQVNLTDEFNNELTTLRGAYGGNLSDLQGNLTKTFDEQINTLRGGYDGNLSGLRNEYNTKYNTLDQSFNEFKNQTYVNDKADILKKAKEIEDLINQEAGDIKTKFDNDLAAFKADYNKQLGNYALNSRVDGLNKAIDAGLTPEEVLTIKTIINSSNFSNLFNDLKKRGVITDVATPTPAQFLRHLRSRNYIIY